MFGKGRKGTGMDKNSMFALLRNSLNSAGAAIDVDPLNYQIFLHTKGDDLPINMVIEVKDASLHLICPLDFVAEEIKYYDVCWNLSIINKGLDFGAFYLNPEDGRISFEYGMIFLESNMSDRFVLSLITLVLKTVDKFDGDLMKLATKVDPPEGHIYV